MTKSPDAGRTRQALREATMASHDRVDALFADFSLDNARDYADFLSAHSRALSALEPAAQPDQTRMPFLAQDLAALGVAPPQSLSLESAGGDGYRWGLLYALEGSRLGGASPAPIFPRLMTRGNGWPSSARLTALLRKAAKAG